MVLRLTTTTATSTSSSLRYPNPLEESIRHATLGQPLQSETLHVCTGTRASGTFEDVTRAVPASRASSRRWERTSAISTTTAFSTCILATGYPPYEALMPNVMLRNVEGRHFVDVTAATGAGHLQKGHGVAFGDLDNDGDEDIVFKSRRRHTRRCTCDSLVQKPWQWQQLDNAVRLTGVKTNRAAIGAIKVRVTLPDALLRHHALRFTMK